VNRIVFFNVAWMKEYRGITPQDIPVHGGSYIRTHGHGAEVFNFQPYAGKMYGFVEAGWKPALRCINITRLGAVKSAESISGILAVWVARCSALGETVVVGWYKDATVYRERQILSEGLNRMLPNGKLAEYFVVADADEQNWCRIPENIRTFSINRGKGGIGQKNIWYAESPCGEETKSKVLEYIQNWHRC